MKIKLTCLLLLNFSCGFTQLNHYSYKRELHGIKDEWHKILLPDYIFGKVSNDLSDLRIYGVTKNNDTLEAPFILRLDTGKVIKKDLAFDLINQSKNDKGYYFTFHLPAENYTNEIQLQFVQNNFDWRVTLEGSQDQQTWFSIVEDYRILSIKNSLTDFQFTTVTFQRSAYRYFRLLIKSKIKPELLTAKIFLDETFNGSFIRYGFQSAKIDQEKKDKQTIIKIDLQSPVPASFLKISIKDKFDYYRRITIQYLSDSFKTEQGWKYIYSTLTYGTLNSVEKNEFKFKSTIARQLKIIIENQDNLPLHIDSVVVQGYTHELMARFTEPATYYLVYGNQFAGKPQYDIDRFTDKIPATVSELQLGDEQLIEKGLEMKAVPLFQNKNWLWVIMAIVIILLGWFSYKMIREKSH